MPNARLLSLAIAPPCRTEAWQSLRFPPVLVARYYRELLRFLQASVKDRETAADLTQESYARVLAVERSGQRIDEPRALLYRTARNLLIDRHRRLEVRGPHVRLEHDDDERPADEPVGPRACEPEVAAMSAQTVDALLATIGALPLRCREAFLLHRFDGLSQVEVARRMGISATMVERHLKLALQACRACQDRLDGTPPPGPAGNRGGR